MGSFRELSFQEMQEVKGGSPMGSDPLATIGYYAHVAFCRLKNRIREINNNPRGGKILGPTGFSYPGL